MLNFVGALDYEPNTEAVEWLVRDVVPVLRAERHDAVVRIVGRGADRVAWVAGVPGVELVGEVDDVTVELARADVSVVPIRVGAGTRLKVVEALAHRLPIVTTTVGCEGIDVRNGTTALVADDAVAFAEACIRLLRDPDRAARLGAAAREACLRHFGPEGVERRWAALLRGA